MALTAKSLQYKPPGAKIKWSMALKSIHELKREPSGYLSSGKIDFQVDADRCGARDQALRPIWECQVCEEVNETAGTTCRICGSVQKGKLLEIKIDSKEKEPPTTKTMAPWKCEVCGEQNDGKRSSCSSCGFAASRAAAAEIETWNCPQCTFKNSASEAASACQVCEAPREHPNPRQPPAVSIARPKYRLSFRSGGSTAFFGKLKAAWATEAAAAKSSDADSVAVGISGLLRRQEERNLAAEASLSTAFSDLDALMRSAGEMVQLAGKMAEKMATSTGAERNAFNDLVESLGIDVGSEETATAIGDAQSSAAEFYNTLAKNVSNLVNAMMSKTGTRVYGLADVYCIYNRTRTTGSLIAPADLLKAARQMSRLSLPVRLHRFTHKGMLCLVPSQDIDPLQLFSLLREIILERGGVFLTAVDLAEKSRVSLFLAGQQLEMAERAGKVVRDGKRKDLPAFYLNIFLK